MIGALLEAARPRVSAADALVKSDDTISVALGPSSPRAGPPAIGRTESLTCQLRVVRDGRLGRAGRNRYDVRGLLEAALASAEVGDQADLPLPAPEPLPEVTTASPEVGAAGPKEVSDLARLLQARLPEAARGAELWAERSAGEVQVGNTRDVLAAYDQTLVGVGLRLALPGPGSRAVLALSHVAAAWPGAGDLERLAGQAERLLAPPLLSDRGRPDTSRVGLAPRAVRSLLSPIWMALRSDAFHGGRSWLAGRLGETVFPPWLTLTDNAQVPSRPGSRPVDDDAVVPRAVTLVDRGRISGWIADLEGSARLDLPPTGHGRRLPFAPPRAAFSNLLLAPGPAAPATLLAELGEGVLVEDLPRPAGAAQTSRVELSTPWAYVVSGGEVVGRLECLRLSGDLPELLGRLVALGRETEWIGAWCGPAMVLDGVRVWAG